jgi:Holliday junction resolvasome RuvABC DNA-binding subunit
MTDSERRSIEDTILNEVANSIEGKLIQKTDATSWKELSERIEGLTVESAEREMRKAIQQAYTMAEKKTAETFMELYYTQNSLANALSAIAKSTSANRQSAIAKAIKEYRRYKTSKEQWQAEKQEGE